MQRLIGILVLVLLAVNVGVVSPAAAGSPLGQVRAAARSGVVPGQYIVTLRSGVKPASFLARSGIATQFVYEAALNGFSAKLSLGQLAALRRSPSVASIEQDQYAGAATTQTGVTWGLDRIDQSNLPLSTTYTYNTSASNVNVYVIDSGIQTNHPQFANRAAFFYDSVGDGLDGRDCNGHGTHVAGIIGSSTYGVAKAVKLWSVRVADCTNSTTYSRLLGGMNWVVTNAVKPAVVNISLVANATSSIDSAATAMVNRGLTVVVAAGNSNANANTFSPARASGVITVAASSNTDAKASFSNYGSVVEVYAPGVNITSTWLNSGTNTISGTSMASPHVAGVAALYLSYYPSATPATVNSWIVTTATSGVIINNPSGTPNKLLFKDNL